MIKHLTVENIQKNFSKATLEYLFGLKDQIKLQIFQGISQNSCPHITTQIELGLNMRNEPNTKINMR